MIEPWQTIRILFFFAKKGPVTFVVHPTLNLYDRQTWEIMATPGGKMMNVLGVTNVWPQDHWTWKIMHGNSNDAVLLRPSITICHCSRRQTSQSQCLPVP